MEEVREAIGIDKIDTCGYLIFIEEHHPADANFLLHAVTSHCQDKNNITCFVLFHSTFGHFHNVGMKLGYNLKKEYNSNVKVVEPLKILSKNIHHENDVDNKDSQKLEVDIKRDNSSLVKQLVQVIKDECLSVTKLEDTQKVYLIIDDLSHLFDLGLDIEDVWLFIRYIRSFVSLEPLLTICISSHVYRVIHEEICQPNQMSLALRHMAELTITVQPLETGYSQNVSGKMVIRWKSQKDRLKFKWPEEMIYLFKLFDRKVNVFTPGSSNVI